MTWRSNATAYTFLAPALFILVVFGFYPILYSFLMSFSKWRILDAPQFIGIENYRHLFHSKVFWVALRNTALYSAVTVPTGLVLALGSALLLNQPIKARAFFRGVCFFPVIVPMVVIALVWNSMFGEHSGIVNSFLLRIGIVPRNWLSNPSLAFPLIMVMSVWKGFGYGMVLYLAGLQQIPESYYEAAKIDGANTWNRFRHITLPLLKPTTLFVVVLALIGSFQVFDQVYVMTQGGPGYSTTVLVHFLYEEAYQRFRMGYACAIAYVLFALVFVVSLIQIRLLRHEN